jgi:hypothetical protein
MGSLSKIEKKLWKVCIEIESIRQEVEDLRKKIKLENTPLKLIETDVLLGEIRRRIENHYF